MSHSLVTFLGRVEKGGDYRTTDYHFPDGRSRRASVLAFPLREWLAADHLVVLGTAGSMWDNLLEGDIAIEGAEGERERLLEEAQAEHVSQERLDALAPRLGVALGCRVSLRIIPAALELAEQQEVLAEMAAATEDADLLSLDVTHGFRHLPMLAYAATLYLRALRPDLSIEGLWYGSLDDREHGRGTLRDLSGLLEISDWLGALQRHDWLGDYSGVAARVEGEDAQLAEHLRSVSFKESIHQGQQARGEIQKARKRLEDNALAGAGDLFKPTLIQRMNWANEKTLDLRQRRQAWNALERGDYLRASLYGFEGFITRLTQARCDPGRVNEHAAREESRKVFESERPRDEWKRYKLLNNLRNVLAHGNRAMTPEAQRAISSAAELDSALRDCFTHLLGVPDS